MSSTAPSLAYAPLPAATASVAQPPQLRDYQAAVVRDVALQWAAGKQRILVVAATGSGKTLIAAELLRHLVKRGRRALVVVHRDVLIAQTADKLASFGIAHGYIKAGHPENRDALIQIASIQTLERRTWWYAAQYQDAMPPTIIFDEAHITAFAQVARKLLAAHPAMRAVGLTATPWRLSPREDMGDLFDGVACAPYPAQLITEGHLVPPLYFGTKTPPDLSAVHTRAGEFVEEDLLEACDQPALIAAIAAEWQRLAADARTLVFCTGVAHARHVAEHFAEVGIAAASVDGDTPIPVRTALYDRLRSGDLRVLTSCAVLQEGFDVPEVGCVVLCRPTKSRALYVQQVGRGLRSAPWAGKDRCIVLDQAGNVGRFGFLEGFTTFELRAGDPHATKTVSAAPPLKECPACQRIVPAATRTCPECGSAFPRARDLRPPARVVPLRALSATPQPQTREDRVLAYRDWLREAHRRGHRPEWASYQYRDLFGGWPEAAWRRGAVLGLHPSETAIALYQAHLEMLALLKDVPDEERAAWRERWLAAELAG